MRLALAAILAAASAWAGAQTAPPLRIVDTWPLTARELAYAGTAPATHRLQLELVMFDDTGWSEPSSRASAAAIRGCATSRRRSRVSSCAGCSRRSRQYSS
jgi:hypothetical protein